MAELVVVGFSSPNDADRVLTELTQLQIECRRNLEDAVLAIRSSDRVVRVKQSVNLVNFGVAAGGLRGAVWSGLNGLLLLNPIAGFATSDTLKPDTSARFLLIQRFQTKKILTESKRFKRHGILPTLSPEQEAKPQAALSRAHTPSRSRGGKIQGRLLLNRPDTPNYSGRRSTCCHDDLF
jgi:uncharacterized membrane protein